MDKEKLREMKEKYNIERKTVQIYVDADVYAKYKEIMKMKYRTSVNTSISNYMKDFVTRHTE